MRRLLPRNEGPYIVRSTPPHPALRATLSPQAGRGATSGIYCPSPRRSGEKVAEGRMRGGSAHRGTPPHPALRATLSPLRRGEGRQVRSGITKKEVNRCVVCCPSPRRSGEKVAEGRMRGGASSQARPLQVRPGITTNEVNR